MHATVESIVERLKLQPHPEGGWFREVYRAPIDLEHPALAGESNPVRAAGTLIYFLLAAGDFSAFHRVTRADEIWQLYAGGPLELHTIDAGGRHELRLLSSDLALGQPAAVVRAGDWQAARPAPGCVFALTGCAVVPGFDFADFEMPPAATLLAAHPGHEQIIRALTRA